MQEKCGVFLGGVWMLLLSYADNIFIICDSIQQGDKMIREMGTKLMTAGLDVNKIDCRGNTNKTWLVM